MHAFVVRRFAWLVAASAAIAAFAVACGSPAGPEPNLTRTGAPAPVTIKIQDNTFETNWIENAIVKFIVEKGYGHKVEEVVLNTVVGQTALQRGDIDVNVELWPGNLQDWWDEQTASGNVVKLGDIYEGGDQFWIIPRWVANQHNIKTVEDMKRPEVVALFKDPEDPAKGAFYNCIIGWQCAEINRAKFKGYGLDRQYNIISPGSAAALDAALVGPMKKKQPVFGYYWAPTSIYGAYEWEILEEPAWTNTCWQELLKARDDQAYTPKQACAYETQPTVVAAHKSFLSKPPELVEFFRRINVGRAPVSRTAAWAVETDIQGAWEKAAVYYLQTFEDRWSAWVPQDVASKVKAALPPK